MNINKNVKEKNMLSMPLLDGFKSKQFSFIAGIHQDVYQESKCICKYSIPKLHVDEALWRRLI